LHTRALVAQIARMKDPFIQSLDAFVFAVVVVAMMLIVAIVYYLGRAERSVDFLLGICWAIIVLSVIDGVVLSSVVGRYVSSMFGS
jgi:hypothetical protein